MSFTNQQPWSGVAGAPDGIVMVRTANFMTLLNGPPQDVLAGQSGSASVPPDMVWDWMNKNLYVCTQSSGDPLATVWTQLEFVGPFVGTDITAVTVNVTGAITDQGPLTVDGATTLNGPTTINNSLNVSGDTAVGGALGVSGSFTALGGGTLGGTFTGSPIFNFPLTVTQPIKLPNNVFLQSADTLGTYRNLVGTDASNNSYLQNAGGNRTGFFNQGASTWLLWSDNNGNVTVPGSFAANSAAITGALTAGSLQSNSSLQVNGSANINNNLTVASVIPGNVVNIGGLSGFGLYNSTGRPLLQFASNEYILFDGSNIVYGTPGTHIFNGTITGSSTIQSPYLHSTGNVQADNAFTGGSVNVSGNVSSGAQVVGNSLNITNAGVIGSVVSGGQGIIYGGYHPTNAIAFADAGGGYTYGYLNGVAVGSLVLPSTERVKHDIKPSTFDGLAAVLRTPLFEFTRTDAQVPTSIGFVAEEQIKVFPESVLMLEDEPFGIDPLVMVAALCAAVQQLHSMLKPGMKA